jgi:ComF family protein
MTRIGAFGTLLRHAWHQLRTQRPIPGWCVLCNDASPGALDLCEPCRAALPWLGDACRRCALPLAPGGTATCAHCAAAPPFTRAVAAFHFAEPVAAMVRRSKDAGSLPDANVLGTLLAQTLQATYRGEPLPACIVPVPLHWRRLLGRGHNQAALLARIVGRRLALPVDHRARRVRHTPPQRGLTRAERHRNIARAFAVHGSYGGAAVALLDDVMTTGATLDALAGAVRAAGAGAVHVWVAARTADEARAAERTRTCGANRATTVDPCVGSGTETSDAGHAVRAADAGPCAGGDRVGRLAL